MCASLIVIEGALAVEVASKIFRPLKSPISSQCTVVPLTLRSIETGRRLDMPAVVVKIEQLEPPWISSFMLLGMGADLSAAADFEADLFSWA